MYPQRLRYVLIGMAGLLISSAARASDIGTAFTYQGSLENPPGTPVDGVSCDFSFALCNDAEAACDPGTVSSHVGIQVTAGVFTIPDVDFGAGAIDGAARWLEITVDCGNPGDPVVLAPRVELTPAPHALALPGLYTQQNATSPNVIGGFSGNTVDVGVVGATISGGGAIGSINSVTGSFGTVGGGDTNTASGGKSTIGGGTSNIASGAFSTIGGGWGNEASDGNAGGQTTVAGGNLNRAIGNRATVGGGVLNTASEESSTVSGGSQNTANGYYSMVPGGECNTAGGWWSFASGVGAKVRSAAEVGDGDGDEGTFVWADNSDPFACLPFGTPFTSTGPNQFLIRASGGVGIGTASPASELDVAGNIHASGTIASGSSITIDGTAGAEKIITSAALEIHTSQGRNLRIEPAGPDIDTRSGPNIIGGFSGNSVAAGVVGATVFGGGTLGATTYANSAGGDFATVGGGQDNVAGMRICLGTAYIPCQSDADCTGICLFANVCDSGPLQGQLDCLSDEECSTTCTVTVGLGATVGGGFGNTAGGADTSTVCGGNLNSASGTRSSIGGGDSNTTSGLASTVPGGGANHAGGDYSFAAGRRAKANHAGAFVWGDSFDGNVTSSANNQFTARTSGGARFYSNTALTAGVNLAAGGGSWTSISDKNLKENFAEIDKEALLERLSAIPITTWNYKSQEASIRHIGPMGQDFAAAFGLGDLPPQINTIDADGVALAAIQGLYEIVQEKDCEVEELRSEIEDLKELIKALGARQAGGQ